MNRIDRRTKDVHATETSKYWRHPCFPDLGLFKARFTRHRYELHTHPTYVIALITAGCERIRIGRRNVVAPAGTIAIVNPEEWHDGEQGADEGWAYRTFYPTVPLMTALARELGRERAPVFSRAIIEDHHLAARLAAAHEGSTSQDATKAEASLLAALGRLIVRHGDWNGRAEEVENAGSRRRFSVYEELIESRLGSPLDLQQLADAARVTRFQVIRDFKKAIGLTPATYIRDRRLRRARLLIEDGLGLADAALLAGFADQSHLTRTFRAAHGMSPGMFRKAG
ncbi:AraC family transcriptional regulator [Mesorhizobium sp. YC-39]|uniref:AraC family transcriptional regulator n=1 Tax=unclassified Mesorhizobium TaxID=325217 RepID=UPI0021E8D982|nr:MULTISPECIES: AraC family transcriptional regulator [unclassified Mesorhizobium]MCV3208747.1 AraC family transcriptional regulator [Mesorhizobium sp. YC-2]MCV3231904.1 AraC family transcriptional regulator [Mesorhizobium sp. YC-39]